jgi:hypothetical protein
MAMMKDGEFYEWNLGMDRYTTILIFLHKYFRRWGVQDQREVT